MAQKRNSGNCARLDILHSAYSAFSLGNKPLSRAASTCTDSGSACVAGDTTSGWAVTCSHSSFVPVPADLGRRGRTRRIRVGRLLCFKHGGHPGFKERPLVLFLANFLAIALACQRFLHALLLAGLQIEGMTLHFLDDVFRLNLAFETAQRVFERLTFLHSNLCQGKCTSKSYLVGSFQNSAHSPARNRISRRFCTSCQQKNSPKPCKILHTSPPADA